MLRPYRKNPTKERALFDFGAFAVFHHQMHEATWRSERAAGFPHRDLQNHVEVGGGLKLAGKAAQDLLALSLIQRAFGEAGSIERKSNTSRDGGEDRGNFLGRSLAAAGGDIEHTDRLTAHDQRHP